MTIKLYLLFLVVTSLPPLQGGKVSTGFTANNAILALDNRRAFLQMFLSELPRIENAQKRQAMLQKMERIAKAINSDISNFVPLLTETNPKDAKMALIQKGFLERLAKLEISRKIDACLTDATLSPEKRFEKVLALLSSILPPQGELMYYRLKVISDGKR